MKGTRKTSRTARQLFKVLVSRLNRRLAVFRHSYRGGEYIRFHTWTVRSDGGYEDQSSHEIRVSIYLLRPLIRVLRTTLHLLERDGLL